jgi:hypothetical protein
MMKNNTVKKKFQKIVFGLLVFVKLLKKKSKKKKLHLLHVENYDFE